MVTGVLIHMNWNQVFEQQLYQSSTAHYYTEAPCLSSWLIYLSYHTKMSCPPTPHRPPTPTSQKGTPVVFGYLRRNSPANPATCYWSYLNANIVAASIVIGVLSWRLTKVHNLTEALVLVSSNKLNRTISTNRKSTKEEKRWTKY